MHSINNKDNIYTIQRNFSYWCFRNRYHHSSKVKLFMLNPWHWINESRKFAQERQPISINQEHAKFWHLQRRAGVEYLSISSIKSQENYVLFTVLLRKFDLGSAIQQWQCSLSESTDNKYIWIWKKKKQHYIGYFIKFLMNFSANLANERVKFSLYNR